MESLNLSPEKVRVDTLLVGKNDFILLNFFSFNLYGIWWTYKAWKYFEEKQFMNVQPAGRALFMVFYQIPLYQHIKRFAQNQGYQSRYSSVMLYIGLISLGLISYAPYPFTLVAYLSFIFYTPAVTAFNEAIIRSDDSAVIQSCFNIKQKILLGLGVLLWVLFLLGLFLN